MDGSGFLEFTEFCLMMYKKLQDSDSENDLKETFRVFSKDDEGCITAEELKFVLTHLPGKVWQTSIIFTDSAPRPIQSISRDVCVTVCHTSETMLPDALATTG